VASFEEAVTRANMRFVPTKTAEQQSALVLHRTRHLLIRQQTSVINAIRAPILPSLALSHRSGAMAWKLPGVGPALATALVASR
jgi:transposase